MRGRVSSSESMGSVMGAPRAADSASRSGHRSRLRRSAGIQAVTMCASRVAQRPKCRSAAAYLTILLHTTSEGVHTQILPLAIMIAGAEADHHVVGIGAISPVDTALPR